MRYLGLCVAVGVGVAGLLAGVGARPAAYAKDAAKSKDNTQEEMTPQEKEYWADRARTHWYIREYQKAQNRIWTFPAQIAVMIRHGDDVLAWCTGCEDRHEYKTKQIKPDGYDPEFRLKDEIRQSRAHVQELLARKEEIAKELPQRMAKAIQTADADTQKGAQTGLASDFDNGRKSLDKAQDLIALAEAVYGPEDAALKQVRADLTALEGRVAQRQKAYWDMTKEKLKRPVEEYKASDLEEVRKLVTQAWAAKYPQDKILAVIVPSNANWRGTVATFNEAEKTVDLEDISLLPVRVVVAGDPGWEWVYTAMAVKSGRTAAPTITADVSYRGKLTSPTELIKEVGG